MVGTSILGVYTIGERAALQLRVRGDSQTSLLSGGTAPAIILYGRSCISVFHFSIYRRENGEKVNRIIYLFVVGILVTSHVALGESFVAGELAPIAVLDRTQVYASTPSVDSTGRLVAFVAYDRFVPEHVSSGRSQVYIYDHQDRSYELISVGMDGFAPADGDSAGPKISGDGRYVTFASASKKLVENDRTGGRYYPNDCFVRDRLLQQTIRASVSPAGEEADSASYSADISGDGRFIVFCSKASNLAENDEDAASDVFVHNLQSCTTRLVSLWSDGTQMDFPCSSPCISSDGKYVAFESAYGADVFVRDIETGTTEVITRGCEGDVGIGAFGWFPALHISDDGRFTVFACLSNKPMPDLPPAWGYIYLFDRETREMAVVAGLDKPPTFSDPLGLYLQQTGGYQVIMSGNGRYVFFGQWEGNHKEHHLYRYDRLSKTTDEVVYASPVPRPYVLPNGAARIAASNRDGSVLAFATQSEEFYQPSRAFGGDYEVLRLKLFRVELWDTPSAVPGWQLHR